MSGAQPLLFMTEGDAETWDSFSGCSRSAVTALRRAGRSVRTANVSLSGPIDWLIRARALWPHRRRWAQRYHTGELGFRLRSVRARTAARAHDGRTLIQTGATFDGAVSDRDLYLLCDGNAAFAARGGEFSGLSHLTDRELAALIEREREVYARCVGVFAFTEKLRQSFIQDFGLDPERVVTTLQGPNLPRIPDERDLEVLKASRPTVLFIGRRFERKGGPTLVAAFERVRAAIPDARLLIVGCQPKLPALPGVEVLGYVPREAPSGRSLRQLFSTSHLYCMPSRYEPFGSVFAEAMLYGLPCIGTREYSSEVVSDGETGWLVDGGNDDELADVLVSALRDRERLRAMGLRAREVALTFFNWDRVARIMLEFIARPQSGSAPTPPAQATAPQAR